MKLVWRIGILLLCLAILGISTALAQDDATDEPTAVATESPTEATAEATADVATETPVPDATVEAEATPEATSDEPLPLAVDGSTSMNGLIQTLVERYQAESGMEFTLDIRGNGPNAAFESLCIGDLGLVMSTRFMTDEEAKACADNNVEFIENLLAYQGVVFLLSPGVSTTLTCVSLADMETVFGLGGEGTKFDVQKFSPEEAATELEVYGPQTETRAHDILSALLPAGDVRSDYTPYEDVATLVETMTTAPGIAAVTYADFLTIDPTLPLSVLQVRNDATGDCIDPSISTMELGTYQAFRPQMLYVALAARNDTAVRDFLTFVNNLESGARQIVSELGYSAAAEPSYARNENNLTIPSTGRTFSRPSSPVVVSTAETGTVTFAGTSIGARIVNTLTGSFKAEFASATLDSRFLGTEQAFAALCAGEADVVLVDRAPTDEEAAACAENNVELYPASVGAEAIVFLVKASDTQIPQCVTIDALVKAFAAPIDTAAETPNAEGRETLNGPVNWNELDASYPDLPLTIFAPGTSTLELGWLFSEAGQNTAFGRSDQEDNVFYPPANFASTANLYNAAAVAKFEGAGLTVAYWSEYQASEHKDALRPLQVGEGCVLPSETTIADGSYPFSAPLTLYFSKANMGTPIVGAFMWSLVSEDTLEGLTELDLAVNNVEALRVERDGFFELIQTAQELAAQQAAEVQAEGTAEPDAMAEAGATAEAESTAEPTAEATEASN